MRKLMGLILALILLTGLANAEDFGRSYREFNALYAENIVFINENTGRHLLPHTPVREYDSQSRRLYRISGGALNTVIYLDELDQQIASCQITLTAPANMRYGDATYNNFTTAGYHSYAILMAMDPGATAAQRYQLVERINQGLLANEGSFETQVGDYRVTCESFEGVAVMLFENELLMPKPTPEPEIEEIPEEGEEGGEEEDEFLG